MYNPTLRAGQACSSATVKLICILRYVERGGSMVECLTQDRGAVGGASPASLCCVLEKDT